MRVYRSLLLAAAAAAAPVFARCSTRDECDEAAYRLVAQMSPDELIGQMTQVDIYTVLNDDRTLNETEVQRNAQLHLGSYLNSPFAGGTKDTKYGWTATEWRDLIQRIQTIHATYSKHPILYG
ncbi:unnamed protein product, partial [Aphanomyces euteiches]